MARSVGSKTYEKWRTLFGRLRSSTQSGSLRWAATAQDDTFIAVFSGAVVLFGKQGSDFFIEIKTTDGETVDRFTDDDLDGGGPQRAYWNEMKDLHADISRVISGADDLLDILLNQLPPADDEVPF
jgi:hypothetical protein